MVDLLDAADELVDVARLGIDHDTPYQVHDLLVDGTAGLISFVKERLGETFFIKDLPFRPDSPMQQKVASDAAKKGVKTITNDEIYKAAEFQAFNNGRAVGKLKVVKMNVDDNPMVAQRFGVTSIPTMMMFKNGKLVDRMVGAAPKNTLQSFIDRNL